MKKIVTTTKPDPKGVRKDAGKGSPVETVGTKPHMVSTPKPMPKTQENSKVPAKKADMGVGKKK